MAVFDEVKFKDGYFKCDCAGECPRGKRLCDEECRNCGFHSVVKNQKEKVNDVHSARNWMFYIIAGLCGFVATPFLIFFIQFGFIITIVGLCVSLAVRSSNDYNNSLIGKIGTAFFGTTLVLQILFWILMMIVVWGLLGGGGQILYNISVEAIIKR
jgi:hypothetical protein